MATIMNARGGSWGANSTWKGAKAPSASDDVLLGFFNQSQPGATYIVNLSEAVTVKALTIFDHNVLNFSALTLSVDSLVIGRGGTLLGTSAQADRPFPILGASGAIYNDGTIAIRGALEFFPGGQSNLLVNSGLVSVPGGYLGMFRQVENFGTFEVKQGLLEFHDSVFNAGTISTEGGGEKRRGSITTRADVVNEGTFETGNSALGFTTLVNRPGGQVIADDHSSLAIFRSATGGVLTISGNSTVQYFGSKDDAQTTTTMNFDGAGSLLLHRSSNFAGNIVGFQAGAKIHVEDVSYDGVNDFYDPRSGVVTLDDGTHTSKLQFIGSYSANDFRFQSDERGTGTLITFRGGPRGEAIDTPEEQIQALYVGYFGRAGDPNGVAYWEHQLEAQQSNPTALRDISGAFSEQAEARIAHSLLVDPQHASEAQAAAFIGSLYENLFDRAPDVAGAQYWQKALLARLGNPQGVGNIVLDVINGAQGLDATTIANRAHGAKLFEDELSRNDLPYGAKAAALADVVIDGVTSDDATVDLAEIMTLDFVGDEIWMPLLGIAPLAEAV